MHNQYGIGKENHTNRQKIHFRRLPNNPLWKTASPITPKFITIHPKLTRKWGMMDPLHQFIAGAETFFQ